MVSTGSQASATELTLGILPQFPHTESRALLRDEDQWPENQGRPEGHLVSPPHPSVLISPPQHPHLCQFPVATGTNDHKHASLKQQKCILSQFLMPEVQNQGVAWASPSFWWPWHSLATSPQPLPLPFHRLLLCVYHLLCLTLVSELRVPDDLG